MTTLTTIQDQAKTTADQALVITRAFNASPKLLWKAWTEPALFMRWWGPKGFTSPITRIDFRTGGSHLNCMRSPEGQDFWSTGVFKEIVPMERLVYTDSFADANGTVVPATHYGMGADFPLEMLVKVTFKAKGKTKTTMTLRHDGIPSGRMSALTEAGWKQSFDKLAGVLK